MNGCSRPGDSIPAKIEEGLEHSRVLVLCMSANAFGSDWAELRLTLPQLSTLNHQPVCEPLNKERRFVSPQLYDAPINKSPGASRLVGSLLAQGNSPS